MATTTAPTPTPFIMRLIGAMALDPITYEEVEADKSATGQAALVVLLSSLAAGIGARGTSGGSLQAALFVSALSLVAWAGWALDGMDSFIYALVLVPALRDLLPRSGLSADQANIGFYGGVLFAVFLVGWGFAFLWGPLADRFGRVRTLILTILCYSLFTFLGCAAMTVWQLVSPSIERVGVLRIPTTRGDRLFITLLGTAFINLAWLGLIGPSLWWALLVSALYGLAVFRWV